MKTTPHSTTDVKHLPSLTFKRLTQKKTLSSSSRWRRMTNTKAKELTIWPPKNMNKNTPTDTTSYLAKESMGYIHNNGMSTLDKSNKPNLIRYTNLPKNHTRQHLPKMYIDYTQLLLNVNLLNRQNYLPSTHRLLDQPPLSLPILLPRELSSTSWTSTGPIAQLLHRYNTMQNQYTVTARDASRDPEKPDTNWNTQKSTRFYLSKNQDTTLPRDKTDDNMRRLLNELGLTRQDSSSHIRYKPNVLPPAHTIQAYQLQALTRIHQHQHLNISDFTILPGNSYNKDVRERGHQLVTTNNKTPAHWRYIDQNPKQINVSDMSGSISGLPYIKL